MPWLTRGRVSGVEGTMEFAWGSGCETGSDVRGQFYEELSDALEAVGVGDEPG